MAAPVVLFVPVDDRPVTLDMVAGLGRAAGVDVRTPDRAALGDRFRAGDAERVWGWLKREAAGGAAALVASAEMVCFGGLVASRKSQATFEEVQPLLERFCGLAARIPSYVSAVIPRTPAQPTDEDASYWATGDRDAMQRHRRRHLRLNGELITAASGRVFRYLLIGQDDTSPGSPSQADRDTLEAQAGALSTTNVLLTSGTDELNARLLARWLNDLTGTAPAVQVLYTYPETIEEIPRYEALPLGHTVGEHVRSTGCRRDGDDAEILLWVHNFEDHQQEAASQTGVLDAGRVDAVLDVVRDAVRRGRVAALADVRFANGADRALVARLLEEPQFAGIAAYAGWNTSSNSLGSVLASATVAHHLRAGAVPGDDRSYRQALLTRIMDDWGYQAIVRPQLTRWVDERGGSAGDLGRNESTLEAMALEQFRGEVLPALRRSFPDAPPALRRATFPWHRLFEIRLELEGAPLL